MTTSTTANDAQAQLKRALHTIRDLRTRLEQVEASRAAPIAIVGMGCRFPGADNPETYWLLLRDGVDAITEVPPDRWDTASLYDPDPDASGHVATRWGGFLDDIDQFDAAFFGIAPREAAQMDPQQRLLLEVAWEALEAGGQTVEGIAGSKTGVFVGVHSHSNDYYLMQAADSGALDTYSGTGTSHSVASGRLSYLLDLRGPSIAIDTACSSSLVAIHMAVHSLRSGECDMALAGGVNVMLEPTFTIAASRMRMLAADGRCKPFDARADGFVRGEGCGMVLLKRLSDALADGDPVLAVILGSAVNQDGHSNGLTAPNSLSQRAVIGAALSDAGVSPEEIGYVEAHGTGTALGDPIEVEALAAALGPRRSADHICALGSAKANIGHLEGAAGVAGLIKVVLSLQNQSIPPLPHFRSLNPHITLDGSPFVIPTAPHPWPEGQRPRYAGLSSFGWSGTNAHLIIGAAPLPGLVPGEQAPTGRPDLLPISARSAAALSDLARGYAERLRGEGVPSIHDLCYSAGVHRSHHEFRLAVVSESATDLAEQLDTFAAGGQPLRAAHGRAVDGQAPGVVFVFSGQGSQWPGMARQLLAEEPVFRAAIERCELAFAPFVDWSLLNLLAGSDSRLDDIDVIQPALFAIQVGLATLWRSWGIVPDAVVGHSMGEVAAAHVAGALDLDDAARVICLRSQLLRRVRGQGAMALVDLGFAEVDAALDAYRDRVAVAVNNAPRSSVISGHPDAVHAVVADLQRRGVFCRPIKVDVASHSPQMDPLLDDLCSGLAALAPSPALVPIFSTVEATRVDGHAFDAAYWARNLRQPVRFAQTIQHIIAAGPACFIELSPHPILLPAIESMIQADGGHSLALASLRRGEPERATALISLGRLYTIGAPVKWPGLFSDIARWIPLPAYPWQHERFWFEANERATTAGMRRGAPDHALLGWRMALADPDSAVWESEISPSRRPLLFQHRLHSVAILPAAAYLELALAAGTEVFGPGAHEISEFQLRRALLLVEDAPTTLQIALRSSSRGDARFQVFSRGEAGWTQHVTGVIRRCDSAAPAPAEASSDAIGEALSTGEFYAELATRGITIGQGLQCVDQLHRSHNELVAGWKDDRDLSRQLLSFDPAFQLTAALAGVDSVYLPTAIDSARILSPLPARVRCHLRARNARGGSGSDLVQDIDLFDEDDRMVAQFRGVQLHRPGDVREDAEEWLFAPVWRSSPLPPSRDSMAGIWLILGDRQGISERLAGQIRARGGHVLLARAAAAYERVSDQEFHLRPDSPGDFDRALTDAFGTNGAGCQGVFYLWGLDIDTDVATEALEQEQALVLGGALHLVQALGRVAWPRHPRLLIATRGAQPVEGGMCAPTQATLWGFGRVCAVEHPELRCTLLDLDPGDDAPAPAHMLAEMLSDDEDQVGYRGDQRHVSRLVRARVESAQPLQLSADHAYLITGGLGAIGVCVARWMVQQGARRLILMARSIPPSRREWAALDPSSPLGRKIAAIRELEAMGATVHLARVDVANPAQLTEFLETYALEGWPPVGGVIHAAAVIDDRLIHTLDLPALLAVLRPKVTGAWLLHHLLVDLDFFVTFSSLGALIGQAGQANYASANAFLDALAHYRTAHGLPALSINWGAWANLGFAETAGGKRTVEHLERQGIMSLSPEKALTALERAMSCASAAQLTVLPIQQETLAAAQARGHLPALLATLAPHEGERQSTPSVSQAGDDPRSRFLALPPAQLVQALEVYVRRQFSIVLKLSEERIDPIRPLGAMGLDSLTALELRNRLERDLQLAVSATVMWNYPTIADLAAHLAERLTSADGVHVASSDSAPDSTLRQSAGEANAARDAIEDMSDEEVMRQLLGGEAR
jgi:myxalamid-type polyketide synthase MxaE and MxaD